MDRRTFLRRGLVAVGVAAVGPLVELRAPLAEAQPALADPPIMQVPPPRMPMPTALWYAKLSEYWDIPELFRVWNSRPATMQEPSAIFLSPTDFTNYGNLLTVQRRYRLSGPGILTFMGFPVIECFGQTPGFLMLVA